MNTMFGSYFKIALRNLIKQRGRTVISLFSLVVGLTSFILLMLCVRYELSYDSFFAHSDRVFSSPSSPSPIRPRGRRRRIRRNRFATNDLAAKAGGDGELEPLTSAV